jgi:hypothetical protein
MPALVNSRVSWLQATIPQGVPFVVGNLHDPHTVLVERIDTLGTVLEARGLLKSLDDSDLVFMVGAGAIRAFANDGQRICVALYRRGKFVEILEGIFGVVRDSVVSGCHARAPGRRNLPKSGRSAGSIKATERVPRYGLLLELGDVGRTIARRVSHQAGIDPYSCREPENGKTKLSAI